jgi:hypothetical protein
MALKKFAGVKISRIFVALFEKHKRAFSSAGSEHLPYKQRVGGSNPSTPTNSKHFKKSIRAFSSAGSEHLPYKQRVGGSNPSTPTKKDVWFTPYVFFISKN